MAEPILTIDGAAAPGGGVGAIHDVTILWNIIAEGLDPASTAKGAHGYGSLVRAALPHLRRPQIHRTARG